MTAFYIILKISALLAIIVLPLLVKKREISTASGLSSLAVNEEGYLEDYAGNQKDHRSIF